MSVPLVYSDIQAGGNDVENNQSMTKCYTEDLEDTPTWVEEVFIIYQMHM